MNAALKSPKGTERLCRNIVDTNFQDLSEENVHVYCRSRKDGARGAVYLIINN